MQNSLGKYKDEVYCDIIDMNACNLLFDRPWQYDVNAWAWGMREHLYVC
jgi:hypothetical protein